MLLRVGTRRGLVALALALASGGIVLWSDVPGSAAARYTDAGSSYPRIVFNVSGTNIVRSFTGTTHYISVKNNNPYALPAVRIIVLNSGLPIDFHELRELTNLGFRCVVLNGVAATGSASAECSGNQLGPGKELRVKLTGGTTVVTGHGTGLLQVGLYPNFPQERASLMDNYEIAINPDN